MRLACPLAGLMALLGCALPAGAGEGDTFRPYLTYSYTQDDNLFRLDDADPLLSLRAPEGKSDSYQTGGVGFILDWRPGRQRVQANMQVNTNRFDKYSDLDFDGQNYNVNWDWQLGNLLSGRLGGLYTVSLGNYKDFRQATVVSNTKTIREINFSGNYRFHSDWLAGVRLRDYTLDYSASGLANSNDQQTNLVLGLYYLGGAIQRVGVEVSQIDGTFPDRPSTGTLVKEYTEQAVRGIATWEVSGKSRLNVSLGYVNRDNEGKADNYSGFEGRLEGDWIPTGKLMVTGLLRRALGNYQYQNASLVVVNEARLTANWLALPKVRVGPTVYYEMRDYQGSTRADDIWGAGLAVSYEPASWGTVSVNLLTEERDSTALYFDYQTNVLSLSASLVF